jgi:hypothetical protein
MLRGEYKFRNVHRVRRRLSDGEYKTHYYHRHTRARLPGKPGSPEFLVAYNAAELSLASQQKAKPLIRPKADRPPDLVQGLRGRDRLFFAEYGWRHG